MPRRLDLGPSPESPDTHPTADEAANIRAALGLAPRIRRHANASGVDYCGSAPVGSAEGASVWTITRITVASAGSVTTATASGVKWSDHLTTTYL